MHLSSRVVLLIGALVAIAPAVVVHVDAHASGACGVHNVSSHGLVVAEPPSLLQPLVSPKAAGLGSDFVVIYHSTTDGLVAVHGTHETPTWSYEGGYWNMESTFDDSTLPLVVDEDSQAESALIVLAAGSGSALSVVVTYAVDGAVKSKQLSLDGSDTLTVPAVAVDLELTLGEYSDLFSGSSDNAMMYFATTTVDDVEAGHVEVRQSVDGGQSWTTVATSITDAVAGPISGAVVVDADDDAVLVLAYHSSASEISVYNSKTNSSATLPVTVADSDGESEAPKWWISLAASQSVPGLVQAVVNVDGNILAVSSADAGETWTDEVKVVETGVLPNSPVHLISTDAHWLATYLGISESQILFRTLPGTGVSGNWTAGGTIFSGTTALKYDDASLASTGTTGNGWVMAVLSNNGAVNARACYTAPEPTDGSVIDDATAAPSTTPTSTSTSTSQPTLRPTTTSFALTVDLYRSNMLGLLIAVAGAALLA